MDEFARIATYFAPLAAKAEGAFGLTDDAAALSVPAGQQLIVTQDTLVEGIHFIGDEPPALLAQKALRVNLSDLAAKGAEPLGYFLSLSLPPRCDDAWVEAFCSGLAADQQEFGITLMGGDSTANPQGVVITITATGTSDRMIRRSSAQAGDLLFVTGTIGDAVLGLNVVQGHLPHNAILLNRYHLPQPRLAFAPTLRAHATAALDVSDGLLQDVMHLCRASGIGMDITLEQVPLSDAAILYAQDADALMPLVTGGDDYEIAFTAPPEAETALQREAEKAGISLSLIGACHEGEGLSLHYRGNPIPLPPALGYRHGS